MDIARRILKVREDGKEMDVVVRIFAPEKGEGGGWRCRYEIAWPDHTHTVRAGGVDSVQALELALRGIGGELYSSDEHKEGRLIFGKPGNGYGFAVVGSLRDLLVGDDAKYL